MGINPNQFNSSGFNPGMMNNPMNFLSQFMQFGKTFQGDPKQAVMNMLNNGQMSQQQFNQLQSYANQIMNTFQR